MLYVPGRILVADHLGHLDRFICGLLGHDYWYIFHSENGYDFEKAIYSERPDVVIVNAHLPQLRLQEFMDELFEKFSTERPYVILAISKDSDLHVQMGMKAKVDDFLIVPFYGAEVLAKIQNFMRQKQDHVDRQNQLEALREQLSEEIQKPITVPQLQLAGPPQPPPPALPPKISMDLEIGTPPKKAPPRRKGADQQKNSATSAPVSKAKSAAPTSLPGFKTSGHGTSSKAQRKLMTMMVLRIDGFDSMINELDAEESQNMCNKLYQAISKEVIRLGGHTTGIQGDTVTALFSASTIFPNHRISAIQAAMQLQLLSLFLGEQIGTPAGRLSISIVLHTTMLTVSVGPKGMERDTTIFGSVLPFSMRLLETCPQGEIIATHDCYGEVAGNVTISKEFFTEAVQSPANAQVLVGFLTGIDAPEFVYKGDSVFRAG